MYSDVVVGSTMVTVGYEDMTEIAGDTTESFTRGEGTVPTVHRVLASQLLSGKTGQFLGAKKS